MPEREHDNQESPGREPEGQAAASRKTDQPLPGARPFVILLHQVAGGEHWDLMLDLGASLATWQLAQDPLDQDRGSGRAIPTRRIGNHRRAYLEYEGALSENRGQVTRVERGTYQVLAETADGWRIRVQAGRLNGDFEITPLAEGHHGQFQRSR